MRSRKNAFFTSGVGTGTTPPPGGTCAAHASLIIMLVVVAVQRQQCTEYAITKLRAIVVTVMMFLRSPAMRGGRTREMYAGRKPTTGDTFTHPSWATKPSIGEIGIVFRVGTGMVATVAGMLCRLAFFSFLQSG